MFTNNFSKNHICITSFLYGGLFTCECTSEEYETYPTISIVIDDVTYYITKENYISVLDN